MILVFNGRLPYSRRYRGNHSIFGFMRQKKEKSMRLWVRKSGYHIAMEICENLKKGISGVVKYPLRMKMEWFPGDLLIKRLGIWGDGEGCGVRDSCHTYLFQLCYRID